MVLLQLHFHTYPFPPKPQPDRHSASPFFLKPIPKTLTSHFPKPSNFLIRCSVADTETLPKSAIQRIAEKLRSLGFTEDDPKNKPESQYAQSTSAGEIFVPLPKQLPRHRVGHTIDPSWSTPENPVPQPGTCSAIVRYHELMSDVNKQKKLVKEVGKSKREEKVPTLAELSLPPSELRRLRTIGIALRQKIKIGKAGITEGIVNGIHERWRRAEVVKVVCEDICKLNMKRTHELLERKTGGLVVWRSGSKILLYRGNDYKYPYFVSGKDFACETPDNALQNPPNNDGECDRTNSSSSSGQHPTSRIARPTLIQGVGSPNKVRFQLPGEAELIEEADRLLEGLGPRFTDWWGYDPQPVDADLLPAVIPGYRKPFRLLPFGVQPKLTDDEMTALRRLGRPLPCHFALGRNRKLQGLAAAIIKLWERCEIAKIAVKRGVQNTNSELMSEELKQLTGGTLLSRDKEFIVLYRGKDFLPTAVSLAIQERRNNRICEKKLNGGIRLSVTTTPELKLGSGDYGLKDDVNDANEQKGLVIPAERKQKSIEDAVKRTGTKLSLALEKKEKAEKLLAEMEKAETPQQPEIDKEGITQEEKYMLRRIGLKMKPFLLLGRRGVFDGTVENMHLHWKYRELVKIISKDRSLEAVQQVAQVLEAESGGILVAVERVNMGYAIIVYRGKNYRRPASLRPRTLLSKREAMKRSLEAQRRESLKLHVLKLTKRVDELKQQLSKDKDANGEQATELLGIELAKVELEDMQSAYSLDSADESESSVISSYVPLRHDEHVEARNNHGNHSIPTSLNTTIEASVSSLHSTQNYELIDFKSARYDDGASPVKAGTASGSTNKDTVLDMACGSGIVDAQSCASDSKVRESSIASSRIELQRSAPVKSENKSNAISARSVHLSNKERLLLRKQALMMKKRPVLAVGKSNVVTGVAKAIKSHFQRHPLAIVNIKGRAKGTSVQEVVFKLEQATGAVLVSQEPSKVILYRGWGAGEKPGFFETNSSGMDMAVAGDKKSVSPELLAAIRAECALQ